MTEPRPDDLSQSLASLRARLHRDVERVSALRAVVERRSELDRLLIDLDRQLDRVQRAAVITLVGATGAGKSTLLNALAGQRIALEGVDRPTTRHPVIYAPRDADLQELLVGDVSSHGTAPVVVRYDPSGSSLSPSPWTAQVLIDAPDLNSIDEQNRAIVGALAERSDVLVVVLHRQSVVEEASVSFLDSFAGRRRLLFVLNRADELTPEGRDSLLEQVRRLTATRWQAPEAPVLSLSARTAQTQPRAEGWSEFCETLHALVRESAIGGVRRLNALGTAARLQALFREVQSATSDDLTAMPEAVATGFSDLQQRCAAEVAARLELRHADLRTLLWGEAAKRWDGPGGWALRSGGVASLGLGAGVALATRNPLLAVGAAAGALAVDQAQQVARDRRIGDVAALLPERAEFASWYAEALSPARMRAARLVGAPDALGLPSADAARADLAAVLDEAWARLVDRDLPAAAQRSVLRFFRLIFDLPVYGMAGWVLYQVAAAFMASHYVGVDFLLSAALLTAAYLLTVRTVIRRALAVRARHLAREVADRARVALTDRAAVTSDAVDDATADMSTTLNRLATLTDTWRADLGAGSPS